MKVREIELEGHIIDSQILTKILDRIMDLDGDFEVLEFRIGKRKTEKSYARILVKGESRSHLDRILSEIHPLGARIAEVEEVELCAAEADRVAPRGFYSTTNHPTYVRYKGEWLPVEGISMDSLIVIKGKRAVCKSISELRKGDLVVVGSRGVRVIPPERPRKASLFEFMGRIVSSERPSTNIIRRVAEEMKQVKSNGGKIAVVAGPAVVHTGAAPYLAEMIRMGYVDLLLGGNALAVHDIECAMFGTSLGMDVKKGEPVPGGHRNHLYAISEIIACGSIRNAVRKGIVKSGIMYECVKHRIPFILAGSIRDDGPLPEVITDVMRAQREMKRALRGIQMVIMLATMLHSIAVGNKLSSSVKTVCVDINPAAITKLMDRGTAQAIGIVTDVGTFLPALVRELRR